MAGAAGDTKDCASCGRVMTWRKAWERNWDDVKYCSDACRKRKVGPQDVALEESIVRLLDQRKAGATICPSEAARLVGDERTLAEAVIQEEPTTPRVWTKIR